MKRNLVEENENDISSPKAICKFIQKASGDLIGHLDSQQNPHDQNADHSYCQVMLEKLCYPNKAFDQPVGYSLGGCPLIRPISPPTSDPDDSDHIDALPVRGISPPVAMATLTRTRGKRAKKQTVGGAPSRTVTTSLNTTAHALIPPSNGERRGVKRCRKILPKRDIKNRVLRVNCSDVLGEKAEELEEVILNMSGQGLEKLEKATSGGVSSMVTTIVLDNNYLQVLPTMSSYEKLTKISLANNRIDSLVWFRRLSSLKELDLSQNLLTNADGLWKLGQLTHINLSGNRIKTLRWRSVDVPTSQLEFIDLSNNRVSAIRDISTLTNLRVLLLQQNQLKSLVDLKKFLPASLIRLTLAENRITNLCDVSELSSLCILRDLTLEKNPCVNALQFVDARGHAVGAPRSFDYRPYVLTWLSSLASLDGVPITNDERTEAKWLLREGRIREESAGTHTALITFLSEMCPLGTCESGVDVQGQGHMVATAADRPSTASTSSEEECALKESPSYQTVHSDAAHKKQWGPPARDKGSCSPSEKLPCEHFIQLIEEKAENHRLKRANERLEDRLEQLALKIRTLEALVGGAVPTKEFGLQLEIEEGDGEEEEEEEEGEEEAKEEED